MCESSVSGMVVFLELRSYWTQCAVVIALANDQTINAVLASHQQGRGGDELGAEFAKGLERSMYAGLTGRGVDISQHVVQHTNPSSVSHMFHLLLLPAGSGLDLTSLCVTSGKICWLLYVDALVLNIDGNVLDALSIASRVGMHTSGSLHCIQAPSLSCS